VGESARDGSGRRGGIRGDRNSGDSGSRGGHSGAASDFEGGRFHRSGDRTRLGAAEAMREYSRPREHRAEGDDLEEREVDGGRDEEPRPGEEEHEDERRGDHETLRQTVKQEGGREQEGRETQHHHSGDFVVQVFVGVQRNAAHERQIHADDRQEECRGGGCTATASPASEPAQVTTNPHGVDDHERSADLERRVEERGREVAERAELAEVQLPPQRVARREDGCQDAADQDDEHETGQVHRGDVVETAGEAPRERGKVGRRDGGADRNAHFGHFRRGRIGRPPTPRDPQPPSAHSGLSRGDDGPRSPRRRRNPSRES
jgi:hypothetical protein